MSGNSPAQEQTLAAERMNAKRLSEAYGIALPALQTQSTALQGAMGTGGEPDYIRSAYEAVRGGERENLALGEAGAMKSGLLGRRGAIQGGNVGAYSPEDYGSKMAGALYGSRVQEAMGKVEQLNKLYGFGLGQAQQAGSAALTATGNELANISGMRNYNSGYAMALGGLNAAGSIYGAFGQRTDPYAAAIKPGGTSGSSGWQGFSGGMGT